MFQLNKIVVLDQAKASRDYRRFVSTLTANGSIDLYLAQQQGGQNGAIRCL